LNNGKIFAERTFILSANILYDQIYYYITLYKLISGNKVNFIVVIIKVTTQQESAFS